MEVTSWIGVVATTISAVVTVATVALRLQTKTQLAAIEKGTEQAERTASGIVRLPPSDRNRLTKPQLFALARDELTMHDQKHARVLKFALAFTVALGVVVSGLFWMSERSEAGPEQDCSAQANGHSQAVGCSKGTVHQVQINGK
ncbi:MAG TPA: hypothetical protein VJU61_02055 [Polyangiaceae bacterium]|nr:hypothetical protein [Polyangiaceae bacterium]